MHTKIHKFQKLTHVIPLYFTMINNIDLTDECMERQEQSFKYSQCYNAAF